MLVVDASAAATASRVEHGFAAIGEGLVAPPLMWSEVRSVLHRAVVLRLLERDEGLAALRRLESAPVRRRTPRRLGLEAWRIADELGWTKTYDAEYLALARLAGAPLATFDRRLRRAAETLGLPSA